MAALRRFAELRPSQPALVVPSPHGGWSTWSWADLDRHSDGLARGLLALGTRPGDRVAIALEPCIEAFGLLVAAWKIGAVAVWQDPDLSVREQTRLVGRAAPRVLIAPSWLHAIGRTVARRAFASIRISVTEGWRWFWGGASLVGLPSTFGPPLFPAPAEADSEALILGVVDPGGTIPRILTHRALAARAATLREGLGLTDTDRVALGEPWLAAIALLAGVTGVLPPENVEPGPGLAMIVRTHQASVAIAPLASWRAMDPDAAALQSLRLAVLVGPGLTRSDLWPLGRLLPPGCRRVGVFGDVDAFPIAVQETAELLAETGALTEAGGGWCVGTPPAGAWVRIVRAVDGRIHHWLTNRALGTGDVGEVVVGGPGVCRDYAGSPEAEHAQKISYGSRILHRTGWLGSFDARGRLWIHGAKENRIRLSDGGIVAPEAAEAVFDGLPGVVRSAVIGNSGRLVLCVEMSPGHTQDSGLEQKLRQATPLGAWIDRVVQVHLPRRRAPVAHPQLRTPSPAGIVDRALLSVIVGATSPAPSV